MKKILLFFILVGKLIYGQSIFVDLPEDKFVKPGTQDTIPIVVGDLTARSIFSYQTKILFDSTVLSCLGASNVGTITAQLDSPIVNCSSGEITLGNFGTTSFSGSGVLVNLIFQVTGQPGDSTALVFDHFIFNSGSPEAITTNGTILVKVNQPPVLTAIGNQVMFAGDSLVVPIVSSDIDNDALTLVAENLPPFSFLVDNRDGSGGLVFTPAVSDTGIFENIAILVMDNGLPALSDTVTFDLMVDILVGVNEPEENGLPKGYYLGQNYPNPFNPTTLIRYQLPTASDVALEIYTPLGQKIRTLVNRQQAAGTYKVFWDGKNDQGGQQSSGLYFYRLVADNFTRTHKMVLMR